ncbi:MAG: hypothetical protein JNJ64_01870 [Flavobacteriales bacterium]|nr:hypothetical protein [Flavobacteriales bacterium]
MNTKFLRTNLLILLGYAVLVQLLSVFERNGASMVVLMGMMVAVVIHVSILVLGGLVLVFTTRRSEAATWVLCALAVGVIGFGTCWGGASLAELYSGPANFH